MAKTLSKLFFGCAVFYFSCAAFGQGAFGQGFPCQHTWQFFRSDKARMEISTPESSRGATIIEELEDGQEKIKHIDPPPDFSSGGLPYTYCINDTIFLFLNDRTNHIIQLYSASAFSSIKVWELVGTYEYERGDFIPNTTSLVVPCKEDKYLFVLEKLVNPEPEKRQAVKFVEATLKDKEFTLGEFIQIDYEGQGIVLDGKHHNMPNTDFTNGLNDGWSWNIPILMDGYVVLVSKKSGHFWILNTETNKIRQAKLYNGLTADQIRRGDYAAIIANVCPAPDGSIVIAARPKRFAVKDVPGLPTKPLDMNFQEYLPTIGMNMQEYLDARSEKFKANIYSHPEIEWWKLDLKEGEFSPMATPEAAPTEFDPAKWSKFQFRVHPDGSVSMVGGW